MNILTIIGLCLLAPFIFVIVFIFINDIIDIFKEDPLEFIMILIALMGVAGVILLYISIY
jgi:hypothetical protein